MLCTPYNFQGINKDCVAALEKTKAVIMTTAGTTSSKTDAVSLSGNKTILSADSGIKGILIDFSRGIERTTDDNEITTSSLNLKEKTMNSNPSLLGYAYLSACDYKTLQGAENVPFDFRIIGNDGKLMLTNQSDGTVKGFRGRISLRYDLPPSDNSQNSYPVQIFFDDYKEFKDFYVNELQPSITELKDVTPIGVGLDLNTAYASGVIKLNSLLRCTGTVYNGFASATEWVVRGSNVDTPAVTLASVANGVCSVTVQKEAVPTDLTSGDYVDIQGVVSSGGFYTYVSDVYRVQA